jgi:hypothetical protein
MTTSASPESVDFPDAGQPPEVDQPVGSAEPALPGGHDGITVGDGGTVTGGRGGRGRRTRLGRAAQVAGVIGLIVCVVLVLGVWFARGWASGRVNDLVGSVDQGLARAGAAATLASGQIDRIVADMGTVADAADKVAVGPAATPEFVQALGARLSAAADRYREFRSAYGNLREQAVSVIDTLNRVDRFVPGVSIPQGPIDALASLDARIQDLDASVSAVVTAANAAGNVSETAGVVSAKAKAIEVTLTATSDLVTRVSDATDSLRTDVANFGQTLNNLLLLIAVFITLIIVYVGALNVAVWALGGHWRSD